MPRGGKTSRFSQWSQQGTRALLVLPEDATEQNQDFQRALTMMKQRLGDLELQIGATSSRGGALSIANERQDAAERQKSFQQSVFGDPGGIFSGIKTWYEKL